MIVRKELPENGELVFIRIKKVTHFGAYCELVEYNNMDVYLPIREVASGWIKNIHEFIKEGQKDVAKVTFVDSIKKAIDISLKKVRGKEKKDKINEYNLEIRAEGLFKQAISAAKMESKEEEIKAKFSKKYTNYSDIINEVAEKRETLQEFGFSDDFVKALFDIVAKNVKPKVYIVSYIAQFNTYDTKTGIQTIQKTFEEIQKLGIKVTYIGAPNYSMISEDSSYPKAEDRIKKAEAIMEKYSKTNNATFTITKEKD